HLRDNGVEQHEWFDTMGAMVVLALDAVSIRDTQIDHVVTVLSNFYEVDPLERALRRLADEKSIWARIQPQLLRANNYVLRYAMAEALAKSRAWSTEELASLVDSQSLNEFELGGYALGLRYARRPRSINSRRLIQLANRPAYCGRS